MQLPPFRTILESRIPAIQDLCNISGQTGVSIGVLQKGEVFTHNVGYRDVENKIPPDEDTLYCIGSCTKAMTAAALGILVDEGKIKWDTKISSIFPNIQSVADPVVAQRSTLRDILSHHTGLAAMDTLWQGINNQLTLDKNNTVAAFNALRPALDFRSGFVYNNILYSLAGNIIEKYESDGDAGGWAEFVKRRILTPLKMTRTTASAKDWKSVNNVANPYVVLLDKTPVKINQPAASSDTLIGSAGGMRSSVREMLIWGKAVLDAHDAEIKHDSPGDSNPLRQMMSILGFSSAVKPDSASEEFYGFGWYNQRLPTRLGPWSANRELIPESIPIVSAQTQTVQRGGGDQTFQVFSHGGLIAGFTTSFYLLPHQDTVVVVLSNSNAHGDSVDWIAQDLIQALFHLQPPVDYKDIAKKTAAAHRDWFKTYLQEPFDRHRGENGSCPPTSLEDFTGEYYLSTLPLFTFRIETTTSEDGTPSLLMTINNNSSQVHVLKHYHYNVWSFLPKSYDEYLTIGYLAWVTLDDFLISFDRNTVGEVESAKWSVEGVPLMFVKAGSEK